MQIYHYTSIQTLALILKFKQIRFTPLSMLDDIQECHGLPETVTRGIYVSCWSKDEAENLAQWSLYTKMKGIRLELPKEFYMNYEFQTDRAKGIHVDNGMKPIYPFTPEQCMTEDYGIAVASYIEDGFFIEMTYDQSFESIKRDGIVKKNGYFHIKNAKIIAGYKNPIWSFQKEVRFYVTVIPRGGNFPDYIDMDINPDVLDSVKVRLHPNCSSADKIIVETLLSSFTSSGTVEDSKLNEIYRTKPT